MENHLFAKGIVAFWRLFLLNSCFLISNLLLISSLLIIRLRFITAPVYLLGMVLTFPAFQALLLTIKRSKIDISIGKLYLCCYGEVFKESCLLAGGYLIIFSVLLINLFGVSFVYHFQLLIPLYLLLIILAIIHLLFSLLIRVNLKISVKDTLRLACYIIIKYPLYGIRVVIFLIGGYMIVMIAPQLSIWIVAPLLGKCLLASTDQLFEKILNQLKEVQEVRIV